MDTLEEKYKVLVVDDVTENIDVLAAALRSEYQVMAATSGAKALKIVYSEELRPDLVLLDIMMPEMDGYEVLATIKNNPTTWEIPVIFVSALGEVQDEEKGLNMGAADYIIKPVNAAIVCARVRNHLELAAQRNLLKEQKGKLEELNFLLNDKIGDALEKLRYQDELMITQSRQAAMGEMLSMIAHQWRQPISVISMATGNIQTLMDLGMQDDTKTQDALRQINEQVVHMSQTIDDFRHFFKPDKEAVPLLLSTVCEGALALIRKSIENYGIEMSIYYDSDIEVNLYEREVIQVLINLFSNARDILVERKIQKPRIKVTLFHDNSMAYIEVCDNGGGVPEEIKKQVFEPYFTTKGDKNGTGLGLYMSKIIVEKHLNGTLEFENRDEGACFCIRLPL